MMYDRLNRDEQLHFWNLYMYYGLSEAIEYLREVSK